jgi:XapX domain-containing protein
MTISPAAAHGLKGIAVALVLGAIVRLLRLPLPAPATLWAALMVVGLTGGYLLVDWLLTR